jgi:hypothetical protein
MLQAWRIRHKFGKMLICMHEQALKASRLSSGWNSHAIALDR